MADDCIFCKISSGQIGELVWETVDVAAFNDLHPKAPVHVLIVPKRHIDRLDDLSDPDVAAALLLAVPKVADVVGVRGAYRVQVNNGKDGGQMVDHLHMHLLGGKKFAE